MSCLCDIDRFLSCSSVRRGFRSNEEACFFHCRTAPPGRTLESHTKRVVSQEPRCKRKVFRIKRGQWVRLRRRGMGWQCLAAIVGTVHVRKVRFHSFPRQQTDYLHTHKQPETHYNPYMYSQALVVGVRGRRVRRHGRCGFDFVSLDGVRSESDADRVSHGMHHRLRESPPWAIFPQWYRAPHARPESTLD